MSVVHQCIYVQHLLEIYCHLVQAARASSKGAAAAVQIFTLVSMPSLPFVSEMAWMRLSNGEVARTKLKSRKSEVESADSRRNETIIPNGTVTHHDKV